jgi:RNA polymerase sigma factor (sigma-70 family)
LARIRRAYDQGSGIGIDVTDYELVKSCLSGRRDTFAEIVARYKRLVFSIIYNFVGASPDVNDLFQEVFLRLFKSLATYNPTYQFSTWTIKIATHVCVDRMRRKKPEHAAMEEIEEVGDDRPNPEDHYIARERMEQIRKAVQELPEEYRIPVILFHQQGLSYETMVEVLGQPMTIIKNRLYRARLMLRDRLCPDREMKEASS